MQKVHKLNRQTLYDLVILRGGYQGPAGQENFRPEVWLSQQGQEFPWVKTRMGLTHIVCEKVRQTWSSTSQAQLLFQPLVSFEPGCETKDETFMSFNLLHYIIMILPFQGCDEKHMNIPTCLPPEAMDLNTCYGHHRKTQAGWKTGICSLRSLARADGAGMGSRPCSNQEPRKERKNGTVTPSPTAEAICSVFQVTELILVNKKLETSIPQITCWGWGWPEALLFPLAPGSGQVFLILYN